MILDPTHRRAAARALARKLRRELAEKQAAEKLAKKQKKEAKRKAWKSADYERVKDFSHRMGAEYARKTGVQPVYWGHKNPNAARAYQSAYYKAHREEKLAKERERYRRKKAVMTKEPSQAHLPPSSATISTGALTGDQTGSETDVGARP